MKAFVRGAAVVLALVSIGTAAFFGWKIFKTQAEYKEGVEAYDLIAEIAMGNTEGPGEIPASSVSGANEETENAEQEDTRNVTDSPDESTENQAISEAKSDGLIERPDLPEIDFQALQDVNPDIIGWIYSPDTVINYPVADGTYNRNGCPFMDVKNKKDFSDENTILYGHHMQNGTMFAGITWYEDQSYYDAHPVLYLITPDKSYQLEPFAGYTTTMDSNAYMLTFASRHDYAEWMREISGRSDFKARMQLTTHDHILTLSTCAYSFQDARYVLHCRMTEITE